MDENFAYGSALLNEQEKWFSSSLARGTDVVADITDRLSSDVPCLHDRANRHHLPTFNPHGGPIAHISQDRNLTLLYTLLSKLLLVLYFICNSWATCLVICSGIRRNTCS